jgi:hypothetical protein
VGSSWVLTRAYKSAFHTTLLLSAQSQGCIRVAGNLKETGILFLERLMASFLWGPGMHGILWLRTSCWTVSGFGLGPLQARKETKLDRKRSMDLCTLRTPLCMPGHGKREGGG